MEIGRGGAAAGATGHRASNAVIRRPIHLAAIASRGKRRGSRRTSVVCGFYRTCVIDGVLRHSPAEWLRRPTVLAESPTLGLTHLQFEVLLTAARESTNTNDFALIAMLGLLGLRILEACAADIADVGEEPGHRVLRVVGKGSKVVLVPLPPAVGRAIERAIDERESGPVLRTCGAAG